MHTGSLNLAQGDPGPGTKRARVADVKEKMCATKKLWDDAQMAKPANEWSGKGEEIRKECVAHGVTSCGTTKVRLGNLRKHYQLPHPDVARRARTTTMADYFKAPQ